ncbi:Ubiquitin domain-containing Steroid reductase [Cryptosporidium tyzzeri]|nr:Ubiquitin domain-containing Steroid reductase [Cryptosporidium tyzzeri]
MDMDSTMEESQSDSIIRIYVKKRSGKHLAVLNIDKDATVSDLKLQFYEEFHYYPERQWFNVASSNGEVLKEGKLEDYGIENGTTLYFKDLGVQISWRLVFFIEYLGPIIIFPIFYFFPTLIYGEPAPPKSISQKLTFALALCHYIKREIETCFVHRFSNATMPIIRLPINCFHYWFIFGASVGYYTFHPKFSPPEFSPVTLYFIAILMCVFESLNFNSHLVLRKLRDRGTKKRGIPYGSGFDLVSCANYFWETLSWICFSFIANCATCWLYTLIAFIQMSQWAMKKHRNYHKEFANYPKHRKAIVPFFL